MHLMLDTLTLLRTLDQPSHLPPNIRETVFSKSSVCFVSIASLWEITFKAPTHNPSFPSTFFALVDAANINVLPITLRHLERLGQLPNFHANPFHRLIIAQALNNQLIIVTQDSDILKYDVLTLQA